MTKRTKKGESAAKPRSRKPRKPHNARASDDWATLDELLLKVGSERRQVLRQGEVVKMGRAERNIRAEIDAALKGDVRALNQLLKLLAKYPHSVERKQTFVIELNGPLADV
jgi:hypothetical protein